MYYQTASEPCLGTYFDEIRNTSVLNREQEIELSDRVREGDPDAKQTLIESNLRLVIKIARKYRTNRVPLSELIQEGNIGLVQAASRYDHRKNAKFSTYAAPWIKQAINRYLNDKTRAVSIPHRKEEKLKRIRLAKETLQHDYGRAASNSEIADFLDISEEDVRRHLSYEVDTCPLETDDTATSIIRFWQDSTYTPERDLMDSCLKADTERMLDRLKDVEQQVIRHRFEINGAKRMTLRELGHHLGISAESVRLLEKRAINKLRVSAAPLAEYLCDN